MFRWVKKIDALGAVLLAVLVALALGAVYAALHFGWFRSPWEMAAVLFVGGCFVAFGLEQSRRAAAAAKPRKSTARPRSPMKGKPKPPPSATRKRRSVAENLRNRHGGSERRYYARSLL